MSDVLRVKLVNAGRILEDGGQGDYVLGHVTARLPDDPDHFLMKPASIGLEEMTVDNIITVDVEGEKVAGNFPRHNEVYIHSEIFRARPEIQCVVHTHAPHAVAFSALKRPFKMVAQRSAIFSDGLPVFNKTTDLIVDKGRGKAVAKSLDKHRALLLQNHGIVTCGESVEEAVFLALSLDQACMMQLWVEAAGGAKAVSSAADLKKKRPRMLRPDAYRHTFEYLVRRMSR
jgi:L-fuculose-phosphate aldolase